MNTRQKGNRNQLAAIRFLEGAGYLVSKVENTNIYALERDCFGVGDLIAIRRIYTSISGIMVNQTEVLFVQVTTNKPHAHKLYMEFASKYCSGTVGLQQMVWKDRKGWVIYTYSVNGDYNREVTYETST